MVWMLNKSLVFLLVALLTFVIFAGEVQGKRLLPQASGVSRAKSSSTASTAGRVGVSVKFKSDRQAIIADFNNLGVASSVTYSLSYSHGGVNEGAGGTISASGDTASRELLFGTCSKGVCRYHTGIKNAKFTVTSTLKGGKKVVKTFRLKV